MTVPILLVEDEEDVRETLKEYLEDRGCRVRAVTNGAEALAVLDTEQRPSLILLDLLMPVMDGWEFLDRFRGRPELAAIPIVLTTSMGKDMAPPGVPLLRKPLDLQQLMQHVDKARTGG